MQQIEGCAPGRRASVTLTVSEADTALALKSGDVNVLGSPRVVALCEQAAVAALEGCLREGQTSVGSWIELEHRAPSPVGAEVTAEAVLLGVHGRRLEFAVTVRDADEEVARCKHRRAIVDRASFGG